MVVANNKADFLGRLPLFSGLSYEALDALARITAQYEYPDRSVIAYQRDMADRLYIVRSGRLEAYRLDDKGEIIEERVYLPGDYFEDIWLLLPAAHTATVKSIGSSRLYVIRSSDFLEFLNDYPGALAALEPEMEYEAIDEEAEAEANAGMFADAWEAAEVQVHTPRRRYAAAGLLDDEIVMYESRRTRYLMALKAMLPLGLAFLVPVLIIRLLFPQGDTFEPGPWAIGAALIPALIFLLVVLFQLLDWWNDYFLITNKRIIHHEFSLRNFHATISEAGISQVQSVESEIPDLIATLLNVGSARITTAAADNVIIFDYIPDPELVKKTINELRAEVQALDFGRIQTSMRHSIEEYFNTPPEYSTVEEDEEMDDLKPGPRQDSGMLSALSSFFGYRIITDKGIIYRKHYFVLLIRMMPPLVIAVLLAIPIYFFPIRAVYYLVGFLLLIDLGWLVWQVEDWRNDTFQVTSRYVIDIDRRPFGFGESRKQAELGNIQNAVSDKPGLLAVLFNYGSVSIDTAGARAEIVFENVANPNRIKSDIFKAQETNRQRQRMRDAGQRQQEYGVLLDVYHQAVEQGRIPKRTPPR